MANYQNNYTSNFEGQDPAGDAGLSLFLNGAEYSYRPSGSDTTVYIPTVEKRSHDYANIVYAITRVLAAGGSPIVTKLGAEFTYTSGDADTYKFVNVSGDNITEMTIDRNTGTVTTQNNFLRNSYITSVNSLADFDTTGKSGMQDLISVANVPADGVYQVSVMLHITPKTASSTKSDLVLQFASSDNTGWHSHAFHAVVDDSQTFAQQLSFSTSVSLKAGQSTLRIQCGGLNTEYLVFVDELTVAGLVVGGQQPAPVVPDGTNIYPSLQEAIADSDNLSVGDVFQTNGFHTNGDGGAASYLVSFTGTANGMDVISLGGGKLCVLQNDKYVDVQQLGAFGDNDHDDSDVLQYAVNISAGTERPVLLTKSYKITKVIYITSSTTIVGQSSKTTSIMLYNNSRLELKRDTGDNWVYEVRMRGFCIFANDVSDFCIASNYVASQCFFEDIYMDHASVACVKIRGSLLYFEGCYFYYSPVGVQLRGNAINFENCNFWESDTAFKCYDDTGVTFLNLSHCWIEHSHRVFDTNGNHIACFAVGTAFQGSTTAGYKVLDPINGDNANVNLSFIQCRFAYPNETGGLFKIITKTIGAGGNSLLKFSNCYVSIPAADYLIDNSAAAIGTLGVVYESSSPIDNVFSNEGTRGAYMGPLMDFRHFTMFNSGLVVGDLKPSLDEVISLRTGYMRYDKYNGQLQCVDNNGTQRGIPWKTSTYLPRLFKNNNDLAKDVDDVREKLNDLIYILKYQGKMLQPGNQDGSLSTVVKIGENDYPVIKIGNYYWLAEDLHEPLGEENVDYVINSNGDYLYKWSALCAASGIESPALLAIKPLSWKMPYDLNWTNLIDSLVGDTKAEKAATLYGVNAFTGFVGNNSTGFSSNANGYYNGSFIDEGVSAKYHSSNANGDLTSVGVFSLLGNDYSYSNTGSSTSFRSCRLCMKI